MCESLRPHALCAYVLCAQVPAPIYVPRWPPPYMCPGARPCIYAQVPAGFRSGSMAAWRNGRCARTLAPIVRPRSAAQWLGRSVQGLCGATDDNAADAHSCDEADAGVWSFATLGVHAHSQGRAVPRHEKGPGGDNQVTWRGAARACLRRCASCSRCRNVSISLRNEECSWCATGLGVGVGVGLGVGLRVGLGVWLGVGLGVGLGLG